MNSFHRTDLDNQWGFVRGAARIMIADYDVNFPSQISDVIDTTTYDAAEGWLDLGATKQGIRIAPQIREEVRSINQDTGQIEPQPVGARCTVTTELAQVILENLQLAQNASSIKDNIGTGINERSLGVGTPHKKPRKRLAVLFKNPKTGLIRAFMFRRVQVKVQSELSYAKSGQQQTVRVEFNCIPDYSILNIKKRIFSIYDQRLPGTIFSDIQYTTASLDPDEVELGVVITGVPQPQVSRIRTSAPTRVRLYSNNSVRNIDVGRDLWTSPGPGVLLDAVTGWDSLTIDLAPETIPPDSSKSPIAVTNLSGSPTAISVWLDGMG